MAKKKQKPTAKKVQDDKLSLGDLLNEDILMKLKNTKDELKAVEQRKQEEELERQREERRLREKNKSFEELLGESNLNWSDFK
ncbi:YqkE family protein [Fredinandcohnia quinoae]|uniref:YqkE family protein n=1 Tax=Fredinandcohnia quinoae TaxID=2918902 RepID=A0AAW5E5F3_9BACI|nr:YqkE family protein [Fredinandcohnia sp. SECRCQ15]MCH1624835.1 YqkE family protein [Fredinandcohnia sp. SECRCQ15]